jgi:hypothetical protein
MVKERFSRPDKILVFLMAFVSVLVGCTVGESTNDENIKLESTQTPKVTTFVKMTPASTSQIPPTQTPYLSPFDTIRATYTAVVTQNTGDPTSTSKPSSIPTLSSQQLCQPFPDDIHYLGNTTFLGYPIWTLLATCKGKSAYIRSPVGEMTLFDYTALTGRFAYGSQEPNESGLWIYDYWINLSEKWLNDQITKAEWASIKNSEGIQFLVTLNQAGTLSVSSEPFQTTPIASDVTHFSISPRGDQVAYVKEHAIYVIPILGGQPRKLADGFFLRMQSSSQAHPLKLLILMVPVPSSHRHHPQLSRGLNTFVSEYLIATYPALAMLTMFSGMEPDV